MSQPVLSESKRSILRLLKLNGPMPAGPLAGQLGTTPVAVRQHLAALEAAGLVLQTRGTPAGRGRPATQWSLTEQARSQFPDEHAELAVGLVEAIREASGERGLAKVVQVRTRRQVDQYRRVLPARGSLRKRVEALARQRTAEGYMADVEQVRPGEYVLTERHCPICDAARACRGLCSAELQVFRETLGDDVEVERTHHLLTDSDRCAYHIRARRAS